MLPVGDRITAHAEHRIHRRGSSLGTAEAHQTGSSMAVGQYVGIQTAHVVHHRAPVNPDFLTAKIKLGHKWQ